MDDWHPSLIMGSKMMNKEEYIKKRKQEILNNLDEKDDTNHDMKVVSLFIIYSSIAVLIISIFYFDFGSNSYSSFSDLDITDIGDFPPFAIAAIPAAILGLISTTISVLRKKKNK
jgi:hypothetical protein